MSRSKVLGILITVVCILWGVSTKSTAACMGFGMGSAMSFKIADVATLDYTKPPHMVAKEFAAIVAKAMFCQMFFGASSMMIFFQVLAHV